jgi:citrate lyase beta subunit
MSLPQPAPSLDPGALSEAAAALREANLAFARRYPGERDDGARQPVHTLIEGAQHWSAGVAAERGAEALRALDAHAPDAATLGSALGIPAHPALDTVARRVREKLAREPVEDYRIDFEDGFGVRADDDEDRHAAAVAAEVARGVRDGTLPPSLGARVKPLTEELRARSLRTLDLLVTGMVERGGLPGRWVVTLPKVTVIEQVDYFVAALRALERALALADGTLRFEIMVEVPQAVLDARGGSLLPRLLDASDGRLDGIDFGTYDYTAACGITAAYQGLRHPACEFAKRAIQAAFAGTGVWLADGSTAVLPVPARDGDSAGVHAGWRLHFDDVRHSLAGGFYQGWDLHPAQLVSRHAAVASFYLEGVEAAGARLRALLDRAARAALVGGVADEPATGQGLLGFFRRGVASGAVTEGEAAALTGLTVAELREPSFVRTLRARERGGVAA